MVFQNDILAGAAGAGGGYTIDQSIRFNDDDTAYLTRTPSSNGDRRTFTWSGWVKIGAGAIASNSYLLATTGGASDSGYFTFYINQTYNSLSLTGYSTVWRRTSQVFRDPSAWYHIVIRVDSTNATADDRIRIYVNGEQVTSFQTSSNPSLNHDFGINTTSNTTYLFSESPTGGGPTSDKCWDGYGAEINFIDGQSLAPTNFGETNDAGVWVPIKYAGTYGTNGFYLKGQDSSALGDDSSGNGNDFTSSGLTSADQVSDSPTLNFPVISPIDYQTGSNVTISDGNLTFQNANSGLSNDARATFALPKGQGKWYFEMEADALGQSGVNREFIGIVTTEYRIDSQPSGGDAFWIDANGFSFSTAGSKGNNGSLTSYGSAWSAGDIIGCAVDLDNNKIWWSINNTWQNSGDPAAGTNAAFTSLSSDVTYAPAFAVDYGTGTSRIIANFGQTGGLTYTPPTGFSQIDSSTLPTPTVTDGSAHFYTNAYTGTGVSGTSITNDANAGDFKPDLLWVKPRSVADNHVWFDSVRGTTSRIYSNKTDPQDTDATALITFETNGFDLDTTDRNYNQSGDTYVGWQWHTTGGTSGSNTDGSITSTVSANTTAKFSIITYTGTGSAATVGHGLGAEPQFIVIKGRTNNDSWGVYPGTSMGYGGQYRLKLNETSSVAASSVYWNNTDATSSVFTVNTDAQVNGSGVDYVAYCFAEVEGFSKFGQYTGNGSTDGTFVWCGFRPAFVIAKRTDSADNWAMYDAARDPYNVAEKYLYADASNAEATFSTAKIDFLSNGFKWRGAVNFGNASGGTYVFVAFAEHPFGGDGVAPVPAR